MPNDEPTPEPHATTRRMKNDARLDDPTVESKTQNYPEEIKEDVMWLAAYMRDRCSGRFDILVDRTRQLGFKTTTENYFYRVLTGRYFQRDEGGKIAGSVDNLAQIIDKLRAGVQLTERAGKTPFIETGTYRKIADLLDQVRAVETVCKFAVIIGPTGAQKTASEKHYCHLNNHGRCVHVEAGETPSLGQFLVDLATRYGHSPWGHAPQLKKAIAASVNDKKLIVVDNVQRLYSERRKENQPIFSYLQKLQDDTGCAIALSFAADRAGFLTEGLAKGYFEQFEGRAGGRDQFLVLDDYTPREDLIEIAEGYGLIPDTDTIAYLEGLSRRPGRCRILFDALQKGMREAKASKRKLTVGLIQKVRGEVTE